MNFSLRPMVAEDIEVIRTWHYPAPYETYDLEADPGDIELMLADVASAGGWFAVVDGDADSDEPIGFFEFVVLDDEVEIGLGLRPDLTGIGLGAALIATGLAFAAARWSPKGFALDVFPWNERAIRAYEGAGFERCAVYTRRFEGGTEREFLRMSRPVR